MTKSVQNTQSPAYQNPDLVTKPAPGSNGSARIRLDIDDVVSQIKGNTNPGALKSATDLYLAHGASSEQSAQDGKQLLADMKAFLADPQEGYKVETDLQRAGYSSDNAQKITDQIASGQSVAQSGDRNTDNTPTA